MITFLKKRSSGILLHISSLPSPYGIGDIGPTACEWLQFLRDAGQSYWQILPLNPTFSIFGNSPYMSFSAFAGNPLFISPDSLVSDGYIGANDIQHLEFSEYTVDFTAVAAFKKSLLQKAWNNFTGPNPKKQLQEFITENDWVLDYAHFMALREKLKNQPWYKWPDAIRRRNKTELASSAAILAEKIDFYIFEQMLFFKQWQKLHTAAREAEIAIIGDLPIYVGLDSADVWANQEIFDLDKKTGSPTHVAGVPPDYFSKTGQRWGNPLYTWNTRTKSVRNKLYDWWEKRLRMCLETMDCVRIDHFRGFESYWSIPAEEKTAMGGTWKKGPGLDFFTAMEQRLGTLPIIAEDLGIITEKVEALRDKCGFPGMKILLFAFDGNGDNSYLLHNINKNSVTYTGTHDNDTAVGWYLQADAASKKQAKEYANRDDDDASRFHKDLIHCAMISPSRLIVIPMQDILGFGNDCRMNRPATSKGNWQWRLAKRFMSSESSAWLYQQARLHNRLPSKMSASTTKKSMQTK